MKKTYKYISAFALLILSLASCTDWLNIAPPGKIVKEKYWKKESDVDAVVATCYRAMTEGDYVDRLIVWGELRSDNVSTKGNATEDLKKINDADILPINEYAKWSSFYKVINYCNEVIKYAPTVVDPNFTKPKLNARLAEALTLRALNYFYLVRAFDEVPFVTEPSVSDNQVYNVPKDSTNKILDRLESDLLQAESWAMTSYANEAATSVYSVDAFNKGRITKNAVRALLADIYLWRNKYDKCITYCDKVISDKSLKLVEEEDYPYFSVFGRKNSTESIFELQFSKLSTTYNTSVENFYGNETKQANGGQYLIVPEEIKGKEKTKSIFSTCFESDIRKIDFIRETGDINTAVYSIFKYSGEDRMEDNKKNSIYLYRTPNDNPANWIIYRLSDVMLMKAEALVEKDELGSALHMVNTTYMRSNPTLALSDSLKAINYISKTEMQDLVLLERQRELMFEGKRWFDLVRMARRSGNLTKLVMLVAKKYSSNLSTSGITKLQEINALYFPIHRDELNANSNLVQNPFYELDNLK